MGLIKTIVASVAFLTIGATATFAAEAPAQQLDVAKLGQVSSPSTKIPLQASGPRVEAAIKVAQRWKRRRRRNRNRAIAGAVALGIAAVIAAEAARSHESHHYGRKCRRWARLCDRGRDWACDKFDYRC